MSDTEIPVPSDMILSLYYATLDATSFHLDHGNKERARINMDLGTKLINVCAEFDKPIRDLVDQKELKKKEQSVLRSKIGPAWGKIS